MTDKKLTLANRLAAIMGSIGGVEKKGKITSTGSGPTYKFARDSDVLLTVIPKMADEGIVMVPEHIELLSVEPNMRGTQIIATVKTSWLVTDGVEELRFESLGMGQDSGDKSLPKAQTNARKYGLFMLLHIVTGDDPDQWSSDADEHRAPVQPQSLDPRRRLAIVASEHRIKGAALEALADKVGVPKGRHATAQQYEQIIALIESPQPSTSEAVAAPQESTPTGDAGSVTEPTPPAATESSEVGVPPSPASDVLDAIVEATGGELIEDKPDFVRKAEAMAAKVAEEKRSHNRQTAPDPEPIKAGL